MASEDPAAALIRLRAFETETHVLQGPTWTGALRSLQACVSTYPEDGLHIARVLRADDGALRASIINGWDSATLAESLVHQVLAVISGWDRDEVRRPTASMLSNGGDPEHPTEWHQFEPARRLASSIWPTSLVEGAIVSGADIVMDAINHPAGDLAQFWTKVVRWEWTQNESVSGRPTGVGRNRTESDDLIP